MNAMIEITQYQRASHEKNVGRISDSASTMNTGDCQGMAEMPETHEHFQSSMVDAAKRRLIPLQLFNDASSTKLLRCHQ
jgi:hypothetical protein